MTFGNKKENECYNGRDCHVQHFPNLENKL